MVILPEHVVEKCTDCRALVPTMPLPSPTRAPGGSILVPVPNEVSKAVSRAEERGLERLILFSDAVVAIAITLLVLPLTELRPEEGERRVELPAAEGDELLSFAISFIVIARFWFAHHGLFRHLVRMDRPLLWLNTGLVGLGGPAAVPDGPAQRGRWIQPRSISPTCW